MRLLIIFNYFIGIHVQVFGYRDVNYEWRMGYGTPDKRDNWINAEEKVPIDKRYF